MEDILKQAVKEAVSAANFMQWFKMEAWNRGFKGEKALDELAMEVYKYFINKK